MSEAKAHDEKYLEAKAAGLPGWGGNDRISKLPRMIDERFFAFNAAPRHGKLLELGCGAGNLSIALAEKGFDVYGVDFSQTAIEWAKENAKQSGKNIGFEVADVCNLLSLKNESFEIFLNSQNLRLYDVSRSELFRTEGTEPFAFCPRATHRFDDGE